MRPLIPCLLLWACGGEANDTASTSSTTGTTTTGTTTTGTTTPGGSFAFERVGGILELHDPNRGRAVFADVMIAPQGQLIATYQLSPFETLCEDKSLYFQKFDRELNRLQDETIAIDVNIKGSVFWPPTHQAGDLGDHKFTIMGDTIYMLTTVPGGEQARLLRFELDFNPIDDLTDDGSVARVGDENADDQLLDMGFGNDGTHLYAQFYNQPDNSEPDEWGAQIYQLNDALQVTAEAVVLPESGTFLTGTSIVPVPAGNMGALEDVLVSFSPNTDYGSTDPIGIHTMTTRRSDLSLISGSTQTIASDKLDLYFPTGADFNEAHQIWVVGYTQEVALGVQGSSATINGEDASACDDEVLPKGENYHELGPSFISIYDADWTLLETIGLNDGGLAMRVMLETEGDDIYVAYDEMDKYAWAITSVAKIEHFRISALD